MAAEDSRLAHHSGGASHSLFADALAPFFGFRYPDEHSLIAQMSPFSHATSLRCDLVEKPDHFEVSADVPGFAKDKVKVEVEGNILKISAEAEEAKEDDKEEGGVKWHRRERSSSSMFRSIKLPQNADADHITASSTDGVLRIAIPKLAGAGGGARRIDVA